MRVCKIYEDPITKQKLEGVAVLYSRNFDGTNDEPYQLWECAFIVDEVVENQRVTRTLDSNDIERYANFGHVKENLQ